MKNGTGRQSAPAREWLDTLRHVTSEAGLSAHVDAAASCDRQQRRVLHLIDTLGLGGAERVLVNTANALASRGHVVIVCCTRSRGALAEDLSPNVQLRVLSRQHRWNVTALVGLARLVRRHRIELVHSHLRHTMQLVSLCKATRLITVPHIFHDHFGEVYRDLTAPWTLRLAAGWGVDAYIGVDEALCRWATEQLGVPQEHVSMFPNGIDVGRFDGASRIDVRREFNLMQCEFVFAMLANLRSQKDHGTLLRALAQLPPGERVGVVVAGSIDTDVDYYESCRSLARELGVASRVRFIGPCSDVARLLGSCDGAVMSSVSESGPLAVLEYMAAGLPFVITDVGELTRQVTPFGAGYIVPPRDPEALAAAMHRLVCSSPEERKEMGRRGREGVRSFAHERQVPQLLALYDGLLS